MKLSHINGSEQSSSNSAGVKISAVQQSSGSHLSQEAVGGSSGGSPP